MQRRRRFRQQAVGPHRRTGARDVAQAGTSQTRHDNDTPRILQDFDRAAPSHRRKIPGARRLVAAIGARMELQHKGAPIRAAHRPDPRKP
ncbi:hypothetical protein GCM10010973_03660 [Cribrihabitans marinus]|nr:hypothetical protein GCM10010973_03660 [Cribrihabitans marinus]